MVRGFATKFMKEVKPGDGVVARVQATGLDEFRPVKFVLGDTSMQLQSGFSHNIVAAVPFGVVKKPSSSASSSSSSAENYSVLPATEEERISALGAGAGVAQGSVKVRVKQGSTYAFVEESAGDSQSREALLNLRAQRKSDKFC